jgi:DTW domain-containing protein YfiP
MLTQRAIEVINNPSRRSVLLYPEECADSTNAHNRHKANHLSADPTTLRLIVLDATWRKSRKMLHLNPVLQSLPRLSLCDPPPSRYAIRKAHHAHQLSTLEATCYALQQCGESAAVLQHLLQSFDGFISQQESYRCHT